MKISTIELLHWLTHQGNVAGIIPFRFDKLEGNVKVINTIDQKRFNKF